jgi:hypothetical protein
MKECFRAGINFFLQKPVTREKIESVVKMCGTLSCRSGYAISGCRYSSPWHAPIEQMQDRAR